MGWWRRLLGKESEKVDPFALVERRDGSPEQVILASLGEARTTASGVAVSEEGSLRNTAVLACVRILANSVAMLPLPVYRRLARGKERASSHPLYPILQEQSNTEMTAFELSRWLMQCVLLWGNGYAEIEWSTQGEVAALWPLQPQMVQVER
jgi:phage portal protein BeeE